MSNGVSFVIEPLLDRIGSSSSFKYSVIRNKPDAEPLFDPRLGLKEALPCLVVISLSLISLSSLTTQSSVQNSLRVVRDHLIPATRSRVKWL
jgi:hypothetical protein